MSLMMLPLELHLHIATHLSENRAKVHLSHLSQTCKTLALIHQPILFQDLRLNRVRSALLPATYAIFTKPILANAVRNVHFPDLWVAPAPQAWSAYVDQQPLRETVVAALSDEPREAIETAARLVREGMREDLIAMLLLTRTPHLCALIIRSLGQRGDDTLARALFRYAAAGLERLSLVEIGVSPRTGELPARDDNEDLSYAYFVDTLRLPGLVSMNAEKFGPSWVYWPMRARLSAYFRPFEGLATENTTLRWLMLSEHYASIYACLGRLLQRLPALEWLEFLPADEDNGSWGDMWKLRCFQEALECRADTLRTLKLPDFLDHGNYEDELGEDEERDPRCAIKLCALGKLTHVDLEGVWVFHHAGESTPPSVYDAQTDPLRLVTILPDSVQDLTLRINSAWADEFHEAMVSALLTLIQQHQDGSAFPSLSFLSLVIAPRRHLKKYSKAVKAAKAAGLKVQALACESRQMAEKCEETPWDRWPHPKKRPSDVKRGITSAAAKC